MAGLGSLQLLLGLGQVAIQFLNLFDASRRATCPFVVGSPERAGGATRGPTSACRRSASIWAFWRLRASASTSAILTAISLMVRSWFTDFVRNWRWSRATGIWQSLKSATNAHSVGKALCRAPDLFQLVLCGSELALQLRELAGVTFPLSFQVGLVRCRARRRPGYHPKRIDGELRR